jgi:hypothetical protein
MTIRTDALNQLRLNVDELLRKTEEAGSSEDFYLKCRSLIEGTGAAIELAQAGPQVERNWQAFLNPSCGDAAAGREDLVQNRLGAIRERLLSIQRALGGAQPSSATDAPDQLEHLLEEAALLAGFHGHQGLERILRESHAAGPSWKKIIIKGLCNVSQGQPVYPQAYIFQRDNELAFAAFKSEEMYRDFLPVFTPSVKEQIFKQRKQKGLSTPEELYYLEQTKPVHGYRIDMLRTVIEAVLKKQKFNLGYCDAIVQSISSAKREDAKLIVEGLANVVSKAQKYPCTFIVRLGPDDMATETFLSEEDYAASIVKLPAEAKVQIGELLDEIDDEIQTQLALTLSIEEENPS